jgi:hypothetical protein
MEKLKRLLSQDEQLIFAIRAEKGPISGGWSYLRWICLSVAVLDLVYYSDSRARHFVYWPLAVALIGVTVLVQCLRWATHSRSVVVALTDQGALVARVDWLRRPVGISDRHPIGPLRLASYGSFRGDKVTLNDQVFVVNRRTTSRLKDGRFL